MVLLAVAYPFALASSCILPTFVPETFDRAAIFSVALGVVAPLGLNLVFTQQVAERRAVREYGGLMERLIEEAIDERKLIEVSLRNRKSYVGFALANKIASWPESHLSLLPVSSGYRDQETQKLVLTTHYAKAIQDHMDEQGMPREGVRDFVRQFRVVFPMSEVVSVRFFDPNFHERFEIAGDG